MRPSIGVIFGKTGVFCDGFMLGGVSRCAGALPGEAGLDDCAPAVHKLGNE